MALVVPPHLRGMSTDEWDPLTWRESDRKVVDSFNRAALDNTRRVALDLPAYTESRIGTAAALLAINEAVSEHFYIVPPEAAIDADAASEAFQGVNPVIDIQSHMVHPGRLHGPQFERLLEFLRGTYPERWGVGDVDTTLLTAASWVSQVFGGSETSVALISTFAGLDSEQQMTNQEIAAARAVIDRYAGTGRVLTHAVINPNLGPDEIARMPDIVDDLSPSGWKVYTLWEPKNWDGPGPRPTVWFLDDEEVGRPFLDEVRRLGPRLVCAHKGIDRLVAGAANPNASPRDFGPVARDYPDIQFVCYHSGFQPDDNLGEGAFGQFGDHGVDRLVQTVHDCGVMPGSNVWAELGSTWFMLMRRPVEAAHVLGKLLLAVGEDRVVWGTDSVWFGPPQFMIDAFRAFEIPERMRQQFGYPELTPAIKEKILSHNAAQLYDIDLDLARHRRDEDRTEWLGKTRRALDELFAG